MTLDEARRILGLGADEDSSSQLKDLQAARDRIAELIRTAPNPVIAARYQSGLAEFDAALNTLRLHLATSGEPAAEPLVAGKTGSEAVVAATSPDAADSLIVAPPVEAGEIIKPVVFGEPVRQLVLESSPFVSEPVTSIGNPPPEVKIVPAARPMMSEAPEATTANEIKTGSSILDPVPDILAPLPPPLANPQPVKPVSPEAAAVRETSAQVPPAQPMVTPAEIVLPAETMAPTARLEGIPDSSAPAKRINRFLLIALLLLLLAVIAGWVVLSMERDKRLKNQGAINELEREGAGLVETRRWQEAREVYEKIEALHPGTPEAADLRHRVEAGIDEEDKQFLQYWNGQALAALETNRLDVAEAAIKEVFSKFPNDSEAAELGIRVQAARKMESLRLALDNARAKLEAREWDTAIAAADEILKSSPGQTDAMALRSEAVASKAKADADLVQARDLFARAAARDSGAYDAEALEWAREAVLLAPQDPAIKALFEKFASYTRTLRVPEEFATPAEALASAHARDRIVIGEGEWMGPLALNVAVELQGAGSGRTFLTCAAENGAAISFGPGAKGARVTGITFRHSSLDPTAERYPAAMVRGGETTFTDCEFRQAAGHGLAVIEGGRATASRCRFISNGWDGVSASGAGSTLQITDSEASTNIEHGIDVWDGATGIFTNNRCEGNNRNGIHIDAGPAEVTVTGNQFRNNHEFGIVLTKASAGKVTGNTLVANFMGGLVIRAAATALQVTGNHIQSDSSPGLALEKGVGQAAYATNEISSANAANPTVKENVDFDTKAETEE